MMLLLHDIYVLIVYLLGLEHVFCQMVMLYDIYVKNLSPTPYDHPCLLIVMVSELE